MPEVRLIDANALEQFYESGTDPLDTYADMTYIRAEHIENAPTIEPEVRHGRWTEKGHCECCGFDMGSRADKWTNVYDFAYCPNCGARMDADHIADVSKKVGGADNGFD